MTHRLRLTPLALAFLILATALYLRVWHIQRESLDGDELFSRRVAMASPAVAMDLIRDDLMHPPLYYFALKTVMPFTGNSANGIRALSLACGLGSILAMLSWGVVLPQLRRAIWLAAALVSLNSVDIFYSQQARSYALYSFLISLLILWALALERFSERVWFWAAGLVLMILTIYTHYVGGLFIAAVCCATLMSSVSRSVKIRLVLITAVAALSFLPWIVPEIAVFKSKHGLGNNIAWQGLPTGYDLRSIWANFVGMPPVHGGAIVALATGAILASVGVIRSFAGRAPMPPRVATLLLAAATLPPLMLFCTSFKPLGLTVFGERHLLPSIFASLVLVAFGLYELSRLMPRPTLAFSAGVICLCSLQLSQTAKVLVGPAREPYSEIADYLRTKKPGVPVYTTWPYGIGATVNFYLGTDRVRPLSAPGQPPEDFVVLYRPAVSKERADLNAFLKATTSSIEHCDYYSAEQSAYGTRLCVVERALLN